MRVKKGLRRRLAARIYIPAAVVVSALAFALPASAAPSATAASSVTAAPSAIAAQLAATHLKSPVPPAYYQGGTLRVRTFTTSSSPAVRALMGAAANQPCRTFTVDNYYNNYLGMTLWNYYQHTFYCWDGVTVTNHVTWESIDIPGWSSAAGWTFKGVISSEFNCFYATARWCSGNHEYSQGEFDYCPIRIGCIVSIYPWISQNEYYNGGYNYSTG